MPNQTNKRTAKFFNSAPNERLRDLLENSKTADFAAALGITSESVRQWTAGYSRPDMDKLAAIARYFDCTTDFLLGLTDKKNEVEQKQFDDDVSKLVQQYSDFPAEWKTLAIMTLNAISAAVDTYDENHQKALYKFFEYAAIVSYGQASALLISRILGKQRRNEIPKSKYTEEELFALDNHLHVRLDMLSLAVHELNQAYEKSTEAEYEEVRTVRHSIWDIDIVDLYRKLGDTNAKPQE